MTSNQTLERGDIYWVQLDLTKGSEIKRKRPCVIVSNTLINKARRTVVVVPLCTSTKAYPPLVVPITSLPQESVAVCDQIRAIDKTRLIKYAGHVSSQDLFLLENGLRQVLSI